MTKVVREEKGIVPKSNRKKTKDKIMKVLENEGAVSLWRLSLKSREKKKKFMKKSSNYLKKEGLVTKS